MVDEQTGSDRFIAEVEPIFDSEAPAPEAAEVVEAAEVAETAEGGVKEPDPTPPPVEEPPAQQSAPPVSDELIKQFQALTQKERALHQQEKEMEATRQQMEQFKGQMELAQSDPLAFMEQVTGLTYEQLTNRVLNENKPGEGELLSKQNRKLQKRIDALEQFQQGREAHLQKQDFDQKRTQFIDDIHKFVENSGEYDLIKAKNAYPLIGEVISEYYAKNKKSLDYPAAAQMVEDYLEAEAATYFQSEKLRQKFGLQGAEAEAPPTGQAERKTNGKSSPGPKTLTNTLAAQTPAREDGLLPRDKSIETLTRKYQLFD